MALKTRNIYPDLTQGRMFSEPSFANASSELHVYLAPRSAFTTRNAVGFRTANAWTLLPQKNRRVMIQLRKNTVESQALKTRMVVKTFTDGPKFSDLFEDDVLVYDTDDKAYRLNQLVNENHSGPTVVAWLRHYGCTLCRQQIKELDQVLKSGNNVRVIAIGSGTGDQAKKFVQETGFEGEMYSDPLRKSYAALNLKKGIESTFNLPALGKLMSSFTSGNPQRWTTIPSDPFQQGGCMVINPQQTVTVLHKDDYAGDHLKPEILLQHCS